MKIRCFTIDQNSARMSDIGHMIYLKQKIEQGISDAEYIERVTNAVSKGNDLCCRLLLKGDERLLPNHYLELGINESVFCCNVLSNNKRCEHYRNIASAFAWELMRRFYRENKNKIKFKRLYPAIRCRCSSSKNHQLFCSNEFVLIADVDKHYPELEKFFVGFEVKQVYDNLHGDKISNKFQTYGNLLLNRIGHSVFIDHGVSFKDAERLFKKTFQSCSISSIHFTIKR